MNKKIILSLVFVIFSLNAWAGSIADLCKKEDLGWHFYCDEKKQKIQKPKEAKDLPQKESALERLEREKQEVEKALAEAIYNPSEENVVKFLLMNKRQLKMAEKFGFETKKAILNNPYVLDATLDNPENTIARRLQSQQERLAKISVVRSLNDRYGVYFFYLSTCPACHKFSPVLKDFSEKHGINVLAVSADGGSLPEWPEYVTNRGQIEMLGIEVFPTVILFDTQTQEMKHVGVGIISQDKLLDNIYLQVGNAEG